MIENKNEVDDDKCIDSASIHEVSATAITNPILTPMNAVMDGESSYFYGRHLSLVQRFYKIFTRLFSWW